MRERFEQIWIKNKYYLFLEWANVPAQVREEGLGIIEYVFVNTIFCERLDSSRSVEGTINAKLSTKAKLAFIFDTTHSRVSSCIHK